MEQLSMVPGCTRLVLSVQVQPDYDAVDVWIAVLQGDTPDDLTQYSEHECGKGTLQHGGDAVEVGVRALRHSFVDACEPFPATFLDLADTIRTVIHGSLERHSR